MSVCVYSVFVFFCVWVAALQRADPPSYRLCKKDYKTEKEAQGPAKGCRAIDEWMKSLLGRV
jgi:hypothetical protein